MSMAEPVMDGMLWHCREDGTDDVCALDFELPVGVLVGIHGARWVHDFAHARCPAQWRAQLQ